MAFPKKPKKTAQTAPVPAPTPDMRAPTVLDVAAPGFQDAAPTEAAVDGPPKATPAEVLADEVAGEMVTVKLSDLDAMMQQRIKLAVDAALAAQVKVAPQSQSTIDATAIATAVAQAILANQNVQNNSEHARRMADALAREAKREKCPCCGQAVSGCGGPWVALAKLKKAKRDSFAELCEEKGINLELYHNDAEGYLADEEGRRLIMEELHHVRMAVFPKNDENAEWYIGLRVNGKTYLSNGTGHQLWVPAVNDFASLISNFESGERRSRQQLKHIRQSGSVSANGQTNIQRPTFSH